MKTRRIPLLVILLAISGCKDRADRNKPPAPEVPAPQASTTRRADKTDWRRPMNTTLRFRRVKDTAGWTEAKWRATFEPLARSLNGKELIGEMKLVDVTRAGDGFRVMLAHTEVQDWDAITPRGVQYWVTFATRRKDILDLKKDDTVLFYGTVEDATFDEISHSIRMTGWILSLTIRPHRIAYTSIDALLVKKPNNPLHTGTMTQVKEILAEIEKLRGRLKFKIRLHPELETKVLEKGAQVTELLLQLRVNELKWHLLGPPAAKN